MVVARDGLAFDIVVVVVVVVVCVTLPLLLF